MTLPYSLRLPPPASPLSILSAPHPILRMVSTPVNFEKDHLFLSEWVQGLLHTLNHSGSGVGLAAPQIGLPARMMVMECSGGLREPQVWINPVIKRRIGEKKSLEGCLSLPGQRFSCRRAKRIEVGGLDQNGTQRVLRLEGLEAICFQHELDHLDGILIEDEIRRADTA